jgi:hypothetical protein
MSEMDKGFGIWNFGLRISLYRSGYMLLDILWAAVDEIPNPKFPIPNS